MLEITYTNVKNCILFIWKCDTQTFFASPPPHPKSFLGHCGFVCHLDCIRFVTTGDPSDSRVPWLWKKTQQIRHECRLSRSIVNFSLFQEWNVCHTHGVFFIVKSLSSHSDHPSRCESNTILTLAKPSAIVSEYQLPFFLFTNSCVEQSSSGNIQVTEYCPGNSFWTCTDLRP